MDPIWIGALALAVLLLIGWLHDEYGISGNTSGPLLIGLLLLVWAFRSPGPYRGWAIGIVTVVAGWLLTAAVRLCRSGDAPPATRSLGDILTLAPDEFEDEVANLLLWLGFGDVDRVGSSGDRGADIVCRDEQGFWVVVQCKHFGPGNRVGGPHMQSFVGTVADRRAKYGIYVTSSEYKPAALEFAERNRVIPIDGDGLLRLMAIADRGDAESWPSEIIRKHRVSWEEG